MMWICSWKGLYATAAIGFGLSLLLFAFRESLIHFYESTAKIIETVANFEIAGFFLPWKSILFGLLVGCLFLYWKIRRRTKTDDKALDTDVDKNKPVLVSGKTLLEIHTANQNIKELTRRLDSAEKTTHLVMRQLEAMTKCLAEVLKEDKLKLDNNNEILKNSLETEL